MTGRDCARAGLDDNATAPARTKKSRRFSRLSVLAKVCIVQSLGHSIARATGAAVIITFAGAARRALLLPRSLLDRSLLLCGLCGDDLRFPLAPEPTPTLHTGAERCVALAS